MATSRRKTAKVEQGSGIGKSGWCLTSVGDHENCKYRACSCQCHGVDEGASREGG